jgi:SET domain-containing protein
LGTKGYGVIALKKIEKGQYVCNYDGEIITRKEGKLREVHLF